MSKPVDLRTTRTLQLVALLSQVASTFAKREEQLVRDLASRRHIVGRNLRHGTERVDTTLEAALSHVESAYASEEKRMREAYQKRRERIQKANTNGIRGVAKRARQAREQRLGEVQMKHLQAERSLPAQIKAVDQSYAVVAERLSGLREALASAERRTSRAFSGYGKLVAKLRGALREAAAEETPNPSRAEELIAETEAATARVEEIVADFERQPFPRFFRSVPLPLWIVLVALGCAALVFALGPSPVILGVAGGAFALGLGAVIFLHKAGLRKAQPAADALVAGLLTARRCLNVAGVAAHMAHEQGRYQVQENYEATYAALVEQWNGADDIEKHFARSARTKIERQLLRVMAQNDTAWPPRLARLEEERTARTEHARKEASEQAIHFSAVHQAETEALDADERDKWATLEREWFAEITPLYEEVSALSFATAGMAPTWSPGFVEAWAPSESFVNGAKFGSLEVDLSASPLALPKSPRLALPGPSKLYAPLCLAFPEEGSMLFESRSSGDATVAGTFNNVLLRLLATMPPGKVTFTVIDPVGLGQNFAGLMHLGDYEESLINRRIWTQRDQIEERLAELSEHIEKVIQMYLRNEFASISEYNARAGSVAEKYHFVVVADFPSNFSETAARRLQSIATSGPRCGVFTLIHWDQRHPSPDGLVADELRKNSVVLRQEGGAYVVQSAAAQSGCRLILDAPPPQEVAATFIHKAGKTSVDSNRVEVPFTQVAPTEDAFWLEDTTAELRIAIGRTGATKLQYLAIGKGTRQHALFAGKTGSGKSTLFHVIITNLALACSPDQVEFYLIDFKKGVEFKCYATSRLPHARVVAIESDREFGLNVLQRVDDELKRRGDLFRKLGVQDVPGYKRAGGEEPMPRTLLIIDEFQEFFVEDDPIAQSASLLFDRIVRQGRAFGIHVLLGSQTLGGAYTLARATLGQMVIRVALQCNEADAYLIMDDTNSAPRLLSRPGEGIYNDAAGAVEGNSPFQVVWLPDDERDVWLEKVRELAVRNGLPERAPIVFEGNAPADVRENALLQSALQGAAGARSGATRCWLGAPNAIKGPTEAVFQRQSGNHLLIVGQREESTLSMLSLALLALTAQHRTNGAKFYFLLGAAPGAPEAALVEAIAEALPETVRLMRGAEIPELMNDLSAELKMRSASGEAAGVETPIFLIIHSLQRFKKLRNEDDFSFSPAGEESANPGAQLGDLLIEGSTVGLHILASLDTFNNVNRSMTRKALSEFEMRVLFQMSANDSASLIDSPKASTLGLHRAIFYNEQQGYMETFRPYAVPDAEWIRDAVSRLEPAAFVPAAE